MYRFLKNFKPTSISHFVNSDDSLPIFTYPWGTFKKNESKTTKKRESSRFCGPSTDEFIKEEFNRTIKLYDKIRKEGYKPWSNYNRHIGGTFLIKKNGLKKFIVLQGNHRMAILSHLGYSESISIRNIKGYKFKIFEKNLKDWPLVKINECTEKHALEIFNLYFKENGSHIEKMLYLNYLTNLHLKLYNFLIIVFGFQNTQIKQLQKISKRLIDASDLSHLVK